MAFPALIRRELVARFGEDRVFLDSTSIPTGTDFAEILLGRLSMCSALLAVIGPRWLAARDSGGRRRIDDSDDWVRRELVEAFRLGIRVVPILLDDAQLPLSLRTGPRTGFEVTRANIRHLSRETFVELVRRGFAGTTRSATESAIEIIAELSGNSEVVLAMKTPIGDHEPRNSGYAASSSAFD